MTCSIFRNEAGNVEKVLAPNGEESKLYSDILALPDVKGDEEVAVDMYLLAYTPSFKNYFGDFENGVVNGLIDDNNEPYASSVMKFITSTSDVEFTKPTKTVTIPSEFLQQSVTSGVQELFESNAELAEVGTPEQYSAYLDSIFPDSKVKDVVYHGKISDNPISKSKSDAQYGSAYYFTSKLKNTKEFGKNIIKAIVNVINPSKDAFEDSGSFTAKRMVEILNQKGYDAIDETSKEYPAQLVVFEPEQIHILGSKEDIEGFKKFVEIAPRFQKDTPTNIPVIESLANVKKVLDRLKEKFGVDYVIVNEPNSDWKGKFQNGKVYINAAKEITKDTPFHEYLHPFVQVLKKENPSLYNKLLTDLQSIDEGLAEIQNVKQSDGYSSLTKEEILDEALVSYIGKLASGNISSKGDVVESKEAGIRQSMLSQFKNWLRKMFNKLFSIKLSELELTNNLQDIANMVSMSDARINVKGLTVSRKANYQLDPRTRTFKEKIRAKANDLQKRIIDEIYFEPKQGEEDPGRVVLEEKSHIYMHTKTGQVYKSTTMAIKGEMNDPEGKYELNRLFGNHFDKTLQNIVEGKTFEEAKSDMTDAVSEDISRRAYDALKGIVVGLISDGSIIIPQFVVSDPASGIAGSLDILVVKPNGEMFIKDLKVSKVRSTSQAYLNTPHPVNEGSMLMGENITTQQQHGIQVAVYKRLAEISGLPISGTSTIHFHLELEGLGDQQKIKDFEIEDEQQHLPSSNEAFVNRIVPTKAGKNKVAGFRKALGMHNPANDDNFLDDKEEMPEEIPADVRTQLMATIENYSVKLRKRMDYLKNLNQTRFDAFSEESKEAAIDKISEVLALVEIKKAGEPNMAFGKLLNYTKDTLDSLYKYMNKQSNLNSDAFIDVVLEAEKFVESYRDIASIPEIGLGSQDQYALMRSVQSRLNAVKAEINPALETYVKNLIRQKVDATLSEEELTNLLREGYDINIIDYNASDMQNTKEKLLAIAANLYMEANQKAKNKQDLFEARIKTAGNKLASALGTKNIDFSFMLNYDDEGNFTGRYLQAIGQKYYDIKRQVYALLKNKEGEDMEYIEIPDMTKATPEQLAHNIEVRKIKEKIQEFRQAEQLDGKNQIISGEHHRYSIEFKNERAKYETPNGQALQNGILVWTKKIGVSDEAYRKYLDRWYDKVDFLAAKMDNGEFKGRVEKSTSYFPKSKCVEIKEITNDGRDMRDPRYVALMNAKSPSEVAKKEFYHIFVEEMKAGLEQIPLDQQQKLLGKVARVADNYLSSAKRKGSSHFKAVTKGVRRWFDWSPKMHSTQRLTDDDGVPVDNLPVLYTNNARNEKRIAAIEQKIKELKDQYIIAKALTSEEYEGELKKLQLSLAIENSKIDYNDINVDLVENLIAFRSMTEKYEQMSNIEGSLLAISKIVEKKKYYQSTSEDKKFVSKGIDSKDIYKAEGESRAYMRMKKWFKMVYYNNDEYDYSQFAQVAKKLQNITSLKGVGFNIFGGVNNYIMGRINNAIEAYGGVYYDRKSYFRAVREYNKDHMPGVMKRLGSSNEGAYKIDKHYSKYEAIVSYFRMVRKYQENSGKVEAGLLTEAAYIFQETGEYNVQSKTGMAIVMGDKFQLTNSQTGETLSIYDAFTFDEQKNELTLKPGFELPEDLRTKVTNYVYEVNKQIHGNYAWEDRMVLQQHALGELGAQFHKWVVPLAKARFQARYDNVVLGTIEGRYRTFYNVMKHVYKTEQGFLAKTTGMLGAFIPGSKTYQNMDEIQVKNMYKNLAELGFFMASVIAAQLFRLLASGLDDDDEQVKRLVNFLIYQQTRQQNEIKTFIPILGISEQFQMLKSPIASAGTLKDYGEFLAATFTLPFPPYNKNYYERGPYDGQLKAWKQLKDIVPAFNMLNRWESFESVSNFYIK